MFHFFFYSAVNDLAVTRVIYNLGYLLLLSFGLLFSASLSVFAFYAFSLFWTIKDPANTERLFIKRCLALFFGLAGFTYMYVGGRVFLLGVFFVAPGLKPKWERLKDWLAHSYARMDVFRRSPFDQDVMQKG
jgi:hypothetical protein